MKNLMKKLKSDITFRPDDGAFRSKLAEMVVDNADGEFADLFSKHNCDISVSIAIRSIEEGIIQFLCVSDLGEQALDCSLSVLNHEELTDLEEQLSRQITLQTHCMSDGAAKVVIRKNINGMFDIHQASQKLGCSPNFLKSRIPCTDYTYREIDGKKEIEEYFWSKKLIDQLCHFKLNGVKTEDVKYLADECCYGDNKWAEEILVSLCRPNFTPKTSGSLPNVIKKRSAETKSGERTPPRPSRKKHP